MSVCLQEPAWKELLQPWKELLQRTGEFLFLAKSLDTSPKLVTTSQSTGLLSLPCWYLAPACFPQLLRSSPWFWRRRGSPGLGLGVLLSWKGSSSGVQGALDLSALLSHTGLLSSHGNGNITLGVKPISFWPGLVSALR